MAQVVVIGRQGEEKLWVADFESGTLLPMEADTIGLLKHVKDVRASGPAVKGIDFAMPVPSTSSVSAGHFEG